MIRFNTLLRVVYTLGVSFMFAQAVSAQDLAPLRGSVLNFAKATVGGGTNTGFAVTNPTSNYADVQFTLYGLDGSPVSSGLVNPVRYRVAPKGQIWMRAGEIFATSKVDGWVQATSNTSGLNGFYLLGDFGTSLEGSEPSQALTTQVIPVVRNDQSGKTEVVVLNPGVGNASLTVTFFNSGGGELGAFPQSLAAHGAVRLRPSSLMPNLPLGTVSARISSNVPVAATAIMDRSDSLLFAAGQSVDQTASVRIAPHFVGGGGFDPVLVLTNPNASPVTVRVTLFGENGGAIDPSLNGPSSRYFNIAGYGSISADTSEITGRVFFNPAINGWLRVDSPEVALGGLLILDKGQSVTAVPLQTSPQDKMIFSYVSETDTMFTGLAVVNPSGSPVSLAISLVREDGFTLAQKSITIPENFKISTLLRDVMPEVVGGNLYVFVQSTAPVYGVGIIGAMNGSFMTSMAASRADAFTPDPPVRKPTVTSVDSGTNLQPNSTVRITLAEVVADPVFTISGQLASARALAPGVPIFDVSVPALEPGFVSLRVQSDGLESDPVVLRVLPADNAPTQIISGEAFYQKLDVTDTGLDLNHPVMVPVRNARVEMFSRSTQTIVAVSETDSRGRFSVPAPSDPNLTVRVISRLRSSDLRVVDNTNLNAPYVIGSDIDGREPHADVLLTDTSRVSGAFNILEVIQRGNDVVKIADAKIAPPAPAVYWSAKNRKGTNGSIAQGFVGTSYFNITNNTAYILGDRNEHGVDSDSDEFDDAVLLHEYAHMLAAKFSRDDSPGGSHVMGDMLDPRVSWSEGWANFFSSVVRNDAIWRDSYGANGANLLRYDLEDNIPPGDKPGYWSEASVDTLLWDLFDDHADATDSVQYPLSQIWAAFTDLRNDQFVYLPYFLEHFLNRVPSATDAVRTMVQSRSIDFQPNVRPSVTNPFPTAMNVGSSVTGFVDSLTPKRNNLIQSSHFYTFTTAGGAASIRLDIVLPADNANANDLDLFLMDGNGHVIDRSDRGLNGQSELISVRLPAGTYVAEIRSFYTKAETGGFVFNSGQYRLSVSVQ